jgi:mannitol/fructose-specific phosphotransferase system IIA component (Ntr-type)
MMPRAARCAKPIIRAGAAAGFLLSACHTSRIVNDVISSGSAKYWLTDAMDPAAVKLSLGGPHRDAVLGELVDLIPELRTNLEGRQTLLRAVQEREQMHSTGIGDGIALPHARNALVGLVSRPMIVFGRHDKGVAYGAIDDQPVRLFFLLVATNVTQHLQFLAQLSRVLRDPRLRDGLLTATTPAKAIALLRDAEASRR